MKLPIAVVAILAPLVLCPHCLSAQTSHGSPARGLTNADIVTLVAHGVPPEQIAGMIRHSPTHFEISLRTISTLRAAGVPDNVIDAMLSARGTSGALNSSGPEPQPTTGATIPPPDIHPEPVTTPPAAPGNHPTDHQTGASAANGGAKPADPSMPKAPSAKLLQARAALIPPDDWKVPDLQKDGGCPIETVAKPHVVDLNFDTGSQSAARLARNGTYCFAIRDANPLYDWLVTINVSEPTGNPIDLLTDGIQTLSKFGGGSADKNAGKPPTPQPLVQGDKCPDLTDLNKDAANLKQALLAMIPTKDSNGKMAYIPTAKSLSDWEAVKSAFSKFEDEVGKTVKNLPSHDIDGCDALGTAEDIILTDYPKLRNQYKDLAIRMSKPRVIYYEQPLEDTLAADLIATPSYGGTAATAKTFHFNPSFGIISSSAGFILTELQARSYSSATAPDPTDPTKTQNVLKVDYGSGIRPALAVLLTGNIPQLNSRNYGFGISAGPVFDISNGKADTSRFGFFGGASLRLTPWIYLTPGVHVGEFADFPQGFTHAGQVIPANTGTPNATKRYTARFAFAITFKLKDLGAPSTSDQTKQAGGTTPKTQTAQ